MRIEVKAENRAAIAYVRRIKSRLQGQEVERTLRIVAFRSWRRLILATPSGWTNRTRRSWKVYKGSRGGWLVVNAYEVMRFLETGTNAHGPTHSRFLFIPLSSRAAHARGWRPGFVFGADYVLARRVRGIRAMRIVEREKELIALDLQQSLVRLIRSMLR